MRNDDHFGRFKPFSKKANILGWNVLRSTMFQVRENPSNTNSKNEILKEFLFFTFEKY